ncbi:MAG: T9SS type A sorting domain-containing protein [Bacteroidia bacterium]|nr:T9SS type A sorting domain-containing protein [Bacteroidia bacterium]
MDKNSTLNKKLKSYSALAGTLIAAGSTADAQIVYTNVNPDVTLTLAGTATYNLDLDNGGVIDFILATGSDTYMYNGTFPVPYNYAIVAPNPVTTNAISGDADNNAIAHSLNDPIDNNLTWNDQSVSPIQYLGVTIPLISYTVGNFPGTTDKYIGFKFDLAGQTHYGWARVDVSALSNQIVLKDYAYDATPNTPIPAGATVTSIFENLANNTNIFATDNVINVQLNKPTVGTLVVTDALGKEIAKETINNTNIAISMKEQSAGVYFVTIRQEEGSYTKKVMIK